jgi:hypothetical protein
VLAGQLQLCVRWWLASRDCIVNCCQACRPRLCELTSQVAATSRVVQRGSCNRKLLPVSGLTGSTLWTPCAGYGQAQDSTHSNSSIGPHTAGCCTARRIQEGGGADTGRALTLAMASCASEITIRTAECGVRLGTAAGTETCWFAP